MSKVLRLFMDSHRNTRVHYRLSGSAAQACHAIRWVGAKEAQLIGQLEIDGNHDFGFDRFGIQRGGRVAPKRDGVYGDLRERGIATPAGQPVRHAVRSDESTDLHRSLKVTGARLERIARRDAFDELRRLITWEGRVRAGG